MLPKNELAKYKIKLPASKKEIEFRGFTVGEEKLLLLAMEDGKPENIVSAISQIFELCTFGKCKIDSMVQVDAEFLFINIRNKSMGEGVDVLHNCSNCSNQIEMTLNLDDIKIIDAEKADPNIKISDNTIVTMSYPTLDKTISLTDDGDPIEVVARCVESIMIGERVYTREDEKLEDIVEYLNGLTQSQFTLLENFFKTMPRLTYETEYTCSKCDHVNKIKMEGLNDFFA